MLDRQVIFSPAKILCGLLLIILMVVIFFYWQSLSPVSNSTVSLPVNVKNDVLDQHKKQSQVNQDNQKTKKITPVTPEEKRVVEERDYLNTIVESGDKKIQELQVDEAALHEEDEKAAAIIAKLDAQVKAKGLSK
jgi:hypothetical protein